MNAEELWMKYCSEKQVDSNTPYEAWAFCGGDEIGDELADLVLAGRKFGTASAYDEYVQAGEEDQLPKVGDLSIILRDNGEAVCVIRNYEVSIRPFGDVDPFHAYAEGEGDRSLSYWREVHKEAFEPDLTAAGIGFTEDSLVVCEKFCVEYIPDDSFVEEELLFAEPSMQYADEIQAYRQEMLDAGSSFDGCFCMKRMERPEDFIKNCLFWSNPRREANQSGTWGNVILVIRKADGKMVGCFQVHNILNERMARYTGNVGYSVRPSERRKGYATKMLARAKDFLSSFGFEEIYVACLPENEGSKRTILANGGEYSETVYLEEDGVYLERYRIRLHR